MERESVETTDQPNDNIKKMTDFFESRISVQRAKADGMAARPQQDTLHASDCLPDADIDAHWPFFFSNRRQDCDRVTTHPAHESQLSIFGHTVRKPAISVRNCDQDLMVMKGRRSW
jgi:hypothetical protein